MPPHAAEEYGAAIRHLTALYSAVQSHVESRREEFASLPDEPSRAGAVIEMRSLVIEARKLQSSLTWVDAISVPALDLGTKYFIELAARRLIDQDVNLVIVPAADSSYATYSDPYSHIISKWGDLQTIAGDRVTIVFLPRREQQSGLLHPLILHELSHTVCQDHGLTKRAFQKATQRKRLIQRFNAATKAVQARSKDAVEQEAALIVADSVRGWTEEALCDAVACFYLGPTYLFAFAVEVLAGKIDLASHSHPPPRVRIALMVQTLNLLGWASTMERHAPELHKWLMELSEQGPRHKDEYGFLVWMLETTANDLRKLVGRQLGAHALAPQESTMKEIGQLLDGGIPPAQTRQGPVDPRMVLLGCWLHAIRDAGGSITNLPEAADASGIDGLLSKGLEMAALANAWS